MLASSICFVFLLLFLLCCHFLLFVLCVCVDFYRRARNYLFMFVDGTLDFEVYKHLLLFVVKNVVMSRLLYSGRARNFQWGRALQPRESRDVVSRS